MGQLLRVLQVEDSEDDAWLVRRALQRGGYEPVHERVETAGALGAALAGQEWDVVIADYHLPDLDAPTALRLVQESGRDLPFLIVSGAIGEETAVAAMRAGAHDYLMKDRLSRLGAVVQRELREAEERRSRRRAEEELGRKHADLRAVLETSPDQFFWVDADGTVRRYHARKPPFALPATFLGRRIQEVLPPEVGRQLAEAMARALASSAVVEIDYSLPAPGATDWFEARVWALHEKQVLIVVRDISARKRAEDGLKMRSRVLDSMSEAVSLADAGGTIVYANPAHDAMFGYEPGELIGRHVTVLNTYPPEENARIVGEVIAQLETRGVWVGEFSNRRKDGTPFTTHARISALETSGKVQWISVQKDITERKQAEAALRRHAAELAHSNAELEQFAYVASHDLQEPLRMVASYMELLARRYQGRLDARADKYIGYAVDGAVRMQMLIHDLLTYSRAGRKGEPFAPADCAAVVDQALANLRAAVRECGAAVDCAGLPTVVADAGQLTQVFQNLIDNAIKFCTPGEPPHVRVSARPGAGEWVFSVSDNGVGIAPEHAERIFLIFQRLHTREQYPGTGIGLAICRKVVERHGGRIWVESRPGHGSTFHFTLPAKRSPDHADGVREEARGDPAGGRQPR